MKKKRGPTPLRQLFFAAFVTSSLGLAVPGLVSATWAKTAPISTIGDPTDGDQAPSPRKSGSIGLIVSPDHLAPAGTLRTFPWRIYLLVLRVLLHSSFRV